MESIFLFLILFLTFFAVIAIIYIKLNKKIKKKEKIYRQSDRQLIISYSSLFQNKPSQSPKSQLDQKLEREKTSVIIIDDRAYWVTNNVFYAADTKNGIINQETIKPVNTENMSKIDIEKMMFILDKLTRRD